MPGIARGDVVLVAGESGAARPCLVVSPDVLNEKMPTVLVAPMTTDGHAYPFRVGATLDLELYDYDEAVHCEVLIVRVVEPGSAESDHYPTGFGVKIIAIDPAQRERLAAMVTRLQSGSEKDLY